MTERQQQTRLLVEAASLLLQYNESTKGIVDAVRRTARTFGDDACGVTVGYLSVTVSLNDEPPVLRSVRELRLNAAVRARIHDVLEQIRLRQIGVLEALELLERVASDAPHHPRWLVAMLLGGAACSFARLLGADAGAIFISGASTIMGVLVRQALGRRHVASLALPLIAAFIGAVVGGIAIRMGWTQSAELVLVVPALMLVPGAHILNGLFDLVDNQLLMSVLRLAYSMGVMVASALGIVLGARLTLPTGELPAQPISDPQLNLLSDVILAGVATCGFAAFFNVPARQLGMTALGGMAGHGVRYLALQQGFPMDTASFFGGLVVGAISSVVATSIRAPVAMLAFAGTVTMIPGSSFYRALGGAMRLARESNGNAEALAAATLSQACQAMTVVGGLAIGLLLGIRLVPWLTEIKPAEHVTIIEPDDLTDSSE